MSAVRIDRLARTLRDEIKRWARTECSRGQEPEMSLGFVLDADGSGARFDNDAGAAEIRCSFYEPELGGKRTFVVSIVEVAP